MNRFVLRHPWLAAFLVAAAFALMASGSGASWRCRGGAQCDGSAIVAYHLQTAAPAACPTPRPPSLANGAQGRG